MTPEQVRRARKMAQFDNGTFRVQVHDTRLCPICRLPLIRPAAGAPWACEFTADHDWNAINADDLERDTRHLWRER